MSLIVTALKMKLAPFGWTEQVKRDQKQYTMSKVSARIGGGVATAIGWLLGRQRPNSCSLDCSALLLESAFVRSLA